MPSVIFRDSETLKFRCINVNRRLMRINFNFIPFSFSFIVIRRDVTTRVAIAYETFESAVIMQPVA